MSQGLLRRKQEQQGAKMQVLPKPSGDCSRNPNECIWVNDTAREHPTIKTRNCDMCGEHICSGDGEWPLPHEEVGEFWDEKLNKPTYGHASCGFERMFDPA